MTAFSGFGSALRSNSSSSGSSSSSLLVGAALALPLARRLGHRRMRGLVLGRGGCRRSRGGRRAPRASPARRGWRGAAASARPSRPAWAASARSAASVRWAPVPARAVRRGGRLRGRVLGTGSRRSRRGRLDGPVATQPDRAEDAALIGPVLELRQAEHREQRQRYAQPETRTAPRPARARADLGGGPAQRLRQQVGPRIQREFGRRRSPVLHVIQLEGRARRQFGPDARP